MVVRMESKAVPCHVCGQGPRRVLACILVTLTRNRLVQAGYEEHNVVKTPIWTGDRSVSIGLSG